MRKIFFDKLHSAQNWILISIAVFCFIISGIDYITEKVENLDKILRIIGHICLLLIWCKMLIFKYSVSWNKVGITIRINNFLGKGFSFQKIKKFQIEDNKLIIYQIGPKKYEFDLSKVEKSSQDKLMEILEQNTVGNNASSPIGGN